MLGALPSNCVGFRARRPSRRTLLIEGKKAVPGRPKPFRPWLVAGWGLLRGEMWPVGLMTLRSLEGGLLD